MKLCPNCKKEKQDTEFGKKKNKSGSVSLQPYCRECNKKYHKTHYLSNTKTYKDNEKERRKQYTLSNRTLLLEFFKSGCVDCGETDLVVLECDHIADDKAFNIGDKMRNVTPSTLQRELNKCQPVCANCHKKRTASRSPSWRTLEV